MKRRALLRGTMAALAVLVTPAGSRASGDSNEHIVKISQFKFSP
jgi:hypothetical protein